MLLTNLIEFQMPINISNFHHYVFLRNGDILRGSFRVRMASKILQRDEVHPSVAQISEPGVP